MQYKKGSTYEPILNTRKKAAALAAAILAAAVLALIYLATAEKTVSAYFPDCMLRTMVGIRCFLCGGTRCAREIVRMNFGKAIYYNPYVVMAGISLLVWYALLIASVLRKDYKPLRISERYLWAVLIGAVLFTIVRNFDFYKSIFY